MRPRPDLAEEKRPYDDPFRYAHAAARGLTDSYSMRAFESAAHGFSVEAVRNIARRPASIDRAGTPRDKISSGTVTLRYDNRVTSGDTLSFGVTAALEKRRFALDFSDGHPTRSEAIGVEAAWNHGPAWRLAAGYRDDMGSGRSSGLLRGIELAEGAARSQQGPWIAITTSPGSPAHDLSFGIKAQALHLSQNDAAALGTPQARDNRVALTAAFRFH